MQNCESRGVWGEMVGGWRTFTRTEQTVASVLGCACLCGIVNRLSKVPHTAPYDFTVSGPTCIAHIMGKLWASDQLWQMWIVALCLLEAANTSPDINGPRPSQSAVPAAVPSRAESRQQTSSPRGHAFLSQLSAFDCRIQLSHPFSLSRTLFVSRWGLVPYAGESSTNTVPFL